jgi:putative aldouronate transport system permease protein
LVSFTDPSVYVPGSIKIWPSKWSLEAYKYIMSGGGFVKAFSNTLYITAVGTPLNVCFNAGLAYMISKRDLPGRSVILKLIIFTMLFGPGMIPHYLNIMKLGLLDTFWACILPATCSAWTLMVMKSFFQSLPSDLEEAAIIDGCSQLQIFYRIILPISKAMLATFTLFSAVYYWNVYFSAVMYISRSSMWPLQVFLQQIILSLNFAEFMDTGLEVTSDVPVEVAQMACIVVACAPIMLVYPFLQKHFAKGIMLGSIKG